jgi:hypothetical protein
MTTGRYVTNCNYIYKVLRTTPVYIIVESNFHGQVDNTKFKKDTFEREFFDGHYVISDTEPVWNVEVGTYSIDVPDYKFKSTTDLNKSFTVDEINELLTNEFLNEVKTYEEVKNCMETLCNIIMKRHFDYVNISRGYFEYTNLLEVGLEINGGHKYLNSFGDIEIKSYRNKIISIKFKPSSNWIKRMVGFETYVWTSLEDLIIKYLTDNQEYINNL